METALCSKRKRAVPLWQQRLKAIRKSVKDQYKKSASKKAKWTLQMKFNQYGTYRKIIRDKVTKDIIKNMDVRIGAQAVHHLLDSEGIRQEMPNIIPPKCNLTFEFPEFEYVNDVAIATFVTLSQYQPLATVNLSEQFENNASQMKEFIDVGHYSSNLCLKVRGKTDQFWCKMLNKNKSALDSAMGAEKPHYIMRYRPSILVYHSMEDVVMTLSGTNVGVGFCNFDPKTKIKGHKMIHFEDEYMDQYQITFYAKHGARVTLEDIEITLKSKNESDTKVLFHGRSVHVKPPDINGYPSNTNNHQLCDPQHYSPPIQPPELRPNTPFNEVMHHSGYDAYSAPTNSVHSLRNDPMTCHPQYYGQQYHSFYDPQYYVPQYYPSNNSSFYGQHGLHGQPQSHHVPHHDVMPSISNEPPCSPQAADNSTQAMPDAIASEYTCKYPKLPDAD